MGLAHMHTHAHILYILELEYGASQYWEYCKWYKILQEYGISMRILDEVP